MFHTSCCTVKEFSSSFIVCFIQINNFRDYSSTADAADAVSPVVESVSVVVVGIEVVVAAKQSKHRARLSLSRSSHIVSIGSQVFTIFLSNPIFLFNF